MTVIQLLFLLNILEWGSTSMRPIDVNTCYVKDFKPTTESPPPSSGTACCEGWTTVINTTVSESNQQCPNGLDLSSLISRSGETVYLCYHTQLPGCQSVIVPVGGISYSQVCGSILAYSAGTSDAFEPYNKNPNSRTIDDFYVDGISLTHGQLPRKHIWTFAATFNDSTTEDTKSCPCFQNKSNFEGLIPPFVGQDYFCESVNRENFNDPLWDGQGCTGINVCCSFNNPPQFCKQLPQPTTEDIELRLCYHNDGEAIWPYHFEIFVH